MNRTKLKNYAPQARRDFIQAMTDRAANFGLTETKIEPVVEKGDVAVIGGRSHPRAVAKKRKSLEDRIKRHGFEPTMEAMAYTWFNRLVAIRFMELHGYLEHGYRVLSHPEGKPTPEILEHAEHIELPGLDKNRVIDLKLAGNKESELYRLLLTAQCNALHTAMPFLFERIDDETELLLPDNLLNSDSLMRKLVGEIEEADWNEVEIIGWLYQFYISEKKDEVIGKVVASEDIPAATQLFTPNWIVKYLVQNTLGRQWLATYPQSALRQQMEYYIEPAEQTPEVQEQLKAITPTSLNPEELTLLDPACGSGHILVEAYDLFRAIYQERGYRAKDIPALILQKNLFGLEIDDRAAQLAAFALMMKARADDRRIFDSEAKPNILAFEDSQGMKASEIHFALTSPLKGEKKGDLESPAPDGHLFEPDDNLFTRAEAANAAATRTPTTANFSQGDIASLLESFESAKTFGSLIQVPSKLAAKLPEIEKRLDDVLKHGDLTHASAHVLTPLLQQTRLLARRYDAVVANPPYLGAKSQNSFIKRYLETHYEHSKADLFASFIERSRTQTKVNGIMALVTMESWMFLSSFESLRHDLLTHTSFFSMTHIGYNSFPSLNSKVVRATAFSLLNASLPQYIGSYISLNNSPHTTDKESLFRERSSKLEFHVPQVDFKLIPSAPLAFWVSDRFRRLFLPENYIALKTIGDTRKGLVTLNDARFIRHWSEVSCSNVAWHFENQPYGTDRNCKWFPINKGGGYRRWFGYLEYVINWHNGGAELKDYICERYGGGSYTKEIRSEEFYFKEAITWGSVTSSPATFRWCPAGAIFSSGGPCLFAKGNTLWMLGLLNSAVCKYILSVLCPTLNFVPGEVAKIPVLPPVEHKDILEANVRIAINTVKMDWDAHETSMEFSRHPLLSCDHSGRQTISQTHLLWTEQQSQSLRRVRAIEEENNELLVKQYGLSNECPIEVALEDITLYRPDLEEDTNRLISYAIGCMMGRYSLYKPGLIYAHSGNQGFDPSQYKTFRADDDGIIPLLETDWGIRDDATNRFVEFVGVAWPKEHLEENLKFVANSIGSNNGEQPRDTIRRYLAAGFYKHHLSMYKKRPIYWLFSSGKQRAFQCLVYLHRYHEGTLARMRTEYVIPLQGQIAGRIEQLEGDKAKATSTSHRKKLQKEQDDLKKQQTELLTFEEKLKHAADQKISLDLDDGVKVNYAKFGDLLAESKAITGGKDEE